MIDNNDRRICSARSMVRKIPMLLWTIFWWARFSWIWVWQLLESLSMRKLLKFGIGIWRISSKSHHKSNKLSSLNSSVFKKLSTTLFLSKVFFIIKLRTLLISLWRWASRYCFHTSNENLLFDWPFVQDFWWRSAMWGLP